jgi:endonuclease/exonuclease/phosphatase family metal-dependent hydrolase
MKPLLRALVLLAGVAGPAAGTTPGSFSVLTYNVAGLPAGLSSSRPAFNTPLISPLLNGYDLVAVQEDFSFHDPLISQATHPHLTEKDTSDSADLLALGLALGLGDGLNFLSRIPFGDFQRVTWDVCFGLFSNASDCLAPKGFAVARFELAPGAELDVYDWHADAGSAAEDEATRREQVRQLYAFMQVFSADRAVVLLGDSNSRYTRAGDILPELLQAAGLEDVWIELARGGHVPPVGESIRTCTQNGAAGGDCELVDKILYRSGGGVALDALAYEVPSELFVDGDGEPLSDHNPVSATFRFRLVPEPAGLAFAVAGALAIAARRARRRA